MAPKNISKSFFCRYQAILNEPRGGGYWIWKPWIVNNALRNLRHGDFLLYMDAGCSINPSAQARFKEYLEIVASSSQGILSMQMEHPESAWTNTATFRHFGVSQACNIFTSGQLSATFLLIRRCEASQEIVHRWLSVLDVDPYLFTDRYSEIDPISNFVEHRHDQSIFSIIRKQNNPTIVADDSWFDDFQSIEASLSPFWGTRLRDSRLMFKRYLTGHV